jgi:hypothetical protein
MTAKTTEPKPTYTIVGDSVQYPLDVSAKGVKHFTIDMDEVEMDGTGTKVKNGRPTIYMTFKITK